MTSPDGLSFLVVDDHPLVREALAAVLVGLRPTASVRGVASAADALSALRGQTRFDLVLLDLNLPDAHGTDLLDTIGSEFIDTAVVVLSGQLDRTTIQRVLASGAVGFIPKTETRDVLASALGLVLAGGVYVPPMALGEATGSASPGDHRAATASTPGSRAGTTPADLGLTGRQMDVLALLMQGKNNKLICRTLGLAEPTVKNHVSAILRALDVDSRTEAVLAVTRLGWQFTAPPAA